MQCDNSFISSQASLARRHPYHLDNSNRRYEVVPTHHGLISETYPPPNPTFSSQKLSNPWLRYSPPPAPLTPQQLAATTIGPKLVRKLHTLSSRYKYSIVKIQMVFPKSPYRLVFYHFSQDKNSPIIIKIMQRKEKLHIMLETTILVILTKQCLCQRDLTFLQSNHRFIHHSQSKLKLIIIQKTIKITIFVPI